jgi:hypothetical protein
MSEQENISLRQFKKGSEGGFRRNWIHIFVELVPRTSMISRDSEALQFKGGGTLKTGNVLEILLG